MKQRRLFQVCSKSIPHEDLPLLDINAFSIHDSSQTVLLKSSPMHIKPLLAKIFHLNLHVPFYVHKFIPARKQSSCLISYKKVRSNRRKKFGGWVILADNDILKFSLFFCRTSVKCSCIPGWNINCDMRSLSRQHAFPISMSKIKMQVHEIKHGMRMRGR